VALGLVLAALGVFVVRDGSSITSTPGYARVGPEVFPWLVGVGLVIIGLLLVGSALRRRWSVDWVVSASPMPASGEVLYLLGRVGLMLLGLALAATLLHPAGFVIAMTVLYVCVTTAFGSRSYVRDIAIGAALAGTVFLVFGMGLGITLPRGRLWGF
jgi:putative tricarboxylic transport membrane protein